MGATKTLPDDLSQPILGTQVWTSAVEKQKHEALRRAPDVGQGAENGNQRKDHPAKHADMQGSGSGSPATKQQGPSEGGSAAQEQLDKDGGGSAAKGGQLGENHARQKKGIATVEQGLETQRYQGRDQLGENRAQRRAKGIVEQEVATQCYQQRYEDRTTMSFMNSFRHAGNVADLDAQGGAQSQACPASLGVAELAERGEVASLARDSRG